MDYDYNPHASLPRTPHGRPHLVIFFGWGGVDLPAFYEEKNLPRYGGTMWVEGYLISGESHKVQNATITTC